MVFNRWGNIVFQTTDFTKAWDGTLTGVKQDTNTFVWICSYQIEGGIQEIKKGTVVLIK